MRFILVTVVAVVFLRVLVVLVVVVTADMAVVAVDGVLCGLVLVGRGARGGYNESRARRWLTIAEESSGSFTGLYIYVHVREGERERERQTDRERETWR